MAPRTSLLALFVELATAKGVDPSDPPPWCHAHWIASGSGQLPPWHPSNPPAKNPEERRHQEAVLDMLRRYKALRGDPDRARDREEALKNILAVTKTTVSKWLTDDLKACRFNSRIDRVLEEQGLTVYSVTHSNLNGVSLCIRC